MKIEIVPHDQAWTSAFEVLRGRLLDALGDRASAVLHVGSTAIPGIRAKPIIDVVLVVADPADEATYVAEVEGAGFVLHLREPDWHEHRLLKCQAPVANVHVLSEGCAEVARMVAFRDLLRSDPSARGLYESRKIELAQGDWGRVQDYADAKTETVESLLRRVSDRWAESCVYR